MATVEIPVPPSVNHLWRAVARVHKPVKVYRNKTYSAWLEPVVMLLRCGLPKYLAPVRVEILIRGGKGFRENRDLDNCAKAILDALRHAERIPDDTVLTVDEIRLRYEPSSGPGEATCFVSLVGKVA